MLNKVLNKTKIVATIGPSSSSKEKLLELMIAGVDVFRLNFSHGTHEEHQKVIHHIRELNAKFGGTVAILQDLHSHQYLRQSNTREQHEHRPVDLRDQPEPGRRIFESLHVRNGCTGNDAGARRRTPRG